MSEGHEQHEGGCLCGAVRYRATGPALTVEYCHCGMCRKSTGAPVSGWVLMPIAAVDWTRSHPRFRASSERAERGFCAECGTPLIYRRLRGASRVALTLGSLDEPERLAPRQHIYTADRVSWLHIVGDLPSYEGAAPH